MKLEELQHVIDSHCETDLHNKISSEIFFEILNESHIDLNEMITKRKKNEYPQFHSFNFVLKELHETKKISIIDSCVYIEETMLNVKDLLSCLNEENLYVLRISLAEKNNIKLKKNSLDVFLYN